MLLFDENLKINLDLNQVKFKGMVFQRVVHINVKFIMDLVPVKVNI